MPAISRMTSLSSRCRGGDFPNSGKAIAARGLDKKEELSSWASELQKPREKERECAIQGSNL